MDTTVIFTWIWMSIGVLVFLYLFFVKVAPYGRHTPSHWGLMISNRIGWIIMESPALFLFIGFFFLFMEFTNKVVLVFVTVWLIHYFYRTLIFPFRIRTKGKKMPLVIALSGAMFNTVNTYLIASFLAKNPELYPNEWFLSWQFILGISVFVVGYFVNQYSDYILIKLRAPGEVNYKIPHGFMYRFITNPNYLGEILEWTGFAIMTWCLPSLAFLVWTIANLAPRALANHKWYLRKFENYPKERKVLFPFVW